MQIEVVRDTQYYNFCLDYIIYIYKILRILQYIIQMHYEQQDWYSNMKQ